MLLWRILRDGDVEPAGGGDSASGVQSGADGAGSQGGGELPSWVEVLPEEAHKDPNILKYKTPEDFYKGYKNNVEMLGRKGVIVPNKDAKPEDREKFYNALGRPEKPEGYKLTPMQNLHKSITITPESTAGYQSLAHKHGLTQEQADGLNKDYLNIVNQAALDQDRRDTEAAQKAETALRQEWGEKFDANRSMVAKGILRAGGQDALDAMGGEKGIGNNPVVLKTLAKVFSLLSEDQINSIQPPVGQEGNSGNETVEEAKQKINAMMNDPKHPINDEKSPNRREAVAERMRLYKIAFPDGGES